MTTIRNKLRLEPARVVALVLALIGLGAAFGLNLSDDQVAAIVALVAAVLALFGGEAVRAQVTPTAALSENSARDPERETLD